jgi:hypothetical protein
MAAATMFRAPAGGRFRIGRVAENEKPDKSQLAAARRFAAEHGKPTRAVVENVGRGVARVVLIGGDGAMGDIVVPSPSAGEALVEAVDELRAARWDAETVGATVIGPAHRRKMAGPRARR